MKSDGKVFDGGKELWPAVYDLTEYSDTRGIGKVGGRIEPFFKGTPHPPDGKILELQLEDGRAMEFFYPSSNSWIISPAGVLE